MYLKYIPKIIHKSFPNYIFTIDSVENEVYLTFDDGPNPKTTEPLLQLLEKLELKATFFCLGENLEKYPKFGQKLLENGHQVENHGFQHLDGFKISQEAFIQNYRKGKQAIADVLQVESRFFRPPYGRIKPGTHKKIDSKIVMWNIMPADFDKRVSLQKGQEIIHKHLGSGSITVLHDNPNSWQKLPNLLSTFKKILEQKQLKAEKL